MYKVHRLLGKKYLKYLTVCLLLNLVCITISAVKPFYGFGTFNVSVRNMTTEVTKTLVNNGFEVLGMFSPSHNDSLSVIVFTCDELTSMATGISNKAAFGSTLRIGIIGNDKFSTISMLNPYYFVNAYYNSKANSEEVEYMTSRIDSLALNAMTGFSENPSMYGYDLSVEELNNYRFLPTMARFDDVVELGVFDEYLEAATIIRQNIMSEESGVELAYEMCFEDKEIAVFGVTFKNDLENELLSFVGINSLSTLPFEILIQDNVAYMLSPKFRIPLYKPDISSLKLLKIMSFSSEIKDAFLKVSELNN